MRKIFYDEDGNIIFLQQCQKCFTTLSVNGEGICQYCGYDNYSRVEKDVHFNDSEYMETGN